MNRNSDNKKKLKVLVAMSPKQSLRDATGQAGGIKKPRVLVAMSGGVDSSVAAKLLKDAGYKVAGVFLHFWKDEGAVAENKCCSLKALTDARRVCAKIGIPFYTMNFAEVFKREVVDDFLSQYQGGSTPNPCVRCNKLVKLGLLIKKARQLGFDSVASGHYIKLKIKNEKLKIKEYKLFKARDKNKDQSYFLYTLNQDELSRLLFPLGDYTKTEVRKLAKKFGLPVAEKKESQEICFIPGKSHNDFLKRHLKLKRGLIKTLDGKKAGEHQGLSLYTIGQRKGVEIGGSGPYYVAKKNYKTNTLYVVKDGNDPALHSDKLFAASVNWISGKEPNWPFKCEAVIRYRHKSVKCVIENIQKPICYPVLSSRACLSGRQARPGIQEGVAGTSISKRSHKNSITSDLPWIAGQARNDRNNKTKCYSVKLSIPQRAITPGQSVVFYRKNEVLGGGIIGG